MADHQIPFFGVAREFAAHRQEIMARIETVLSSGQVLQGKEIPSLESRLAKLTGRKYAVAVNSATDALFFALLASGIQPGDEVLVPDFTFIASASCVSRLGAVPVFVDVELETLNIDVSQLDRALSSKTKAVILAHTLGNPFDIKAVKDFCKPTFFQKGTSCSLNIKIKNPTTKKMTTIIKFMDADII